MDSVEFCQANQGSLRVWLGTRNCSARNAVESGDIFNSFRLHRAISHSCVDIRVLLDLWGYSLGLSGVPSSKSRLLTCLIGNTKLLCTQYRGIGPHLSATGKSHGFSRVGAETWGIFSSYGGDGHSRLVFVQRSQDSCLVMMGTILQIYFFLLFLSITFPNIFYLLYIRII